MEKTACGIFFVLSFSTIVLVNSQLTVIQPRPYISAAYILNGNSRDILGSSSNIHRQLRQPDIDRFDNFADHTNSEDNTALPSTTVSLNNEYGERVPPPFDSPSNNNGPISNSFNIDSRNPSNNRQNQNSNNFNNDARNSNSNNRQNSNNFNSESRNSNNFNSESRNSNNFNSETRNSNNRQNSNKFDVESVTPSNDRKQQSTKFNADSIRLIDPFKQPDPYEISNDPDFNINFAEDNAINKTERKFSNRDGVYSLKEQSFFAASNQDSTFAPSENNEDNDSNNNNNNNSGPGGYSENVQTSSTNQNLEEDEDFVLNKLTRTDTKKKRLTQCVKTCIDEVFLDLLK